MSPQQDKMTIRIESPNSAFTVHGKSSTLADPYSVSSGRWYLDIVVFVYIPVHKGKAGIEILN